jgi:hypothetical protein
MISFPKASRWARVANSSVLTDAFLVCAVSTIVVTRSYLAATGYPQVGGNGLHISHMLWGGLLMLIALLVAALFIGRGNRLPVAVVGGVGFGLFVDEIGKFITSDNDYFFKPTFALVYIVLVGIYFLTKVLVAPRPLKPHELVLNATDFLQEAASGRLTQRQKVTGLYRLQTADGTPLAAQIRDLLRRIEPVPHSTSPLETVRTWYEDQRESGGLRKGITAWFALQIALLVGEVAIVTLFVHGAWTSGRQDAFGRLAGDTLGLSAIMAITAATVAASIVLTIIAIVRLKSGLHHAYRAFENSLLLSIFATQVLAFFQSWVVAILALGFAVPAWVILRVFIDEEGYEEALASLGIDDGTSQPGREPAAIPERRRTG